MARLLRSESLSYLLYPILAPWIQPLPLQVHLAIRRPNFLVYSTQAETTCSWHLFGTPTLCPHKALLQKLLTQVSACQSDEVAEREDTH